MSLATAAQRPVLLAQRAQLLARLGRDAAWQVLAQASAARVEPEAGVELELALADLKGTHECLLFPTGESLS